MSNNCVHLTGDPAAYAAAIARYEKANAEMALRVAEAASRIAPHPRPLSPEYRGEGSCNS